MQNAVFFVPKGYRNIGGLYLPINHYNDYLNKNGINVQIIEIPYHKDSSFNVIKKTIFNLDHLNECYLVGFTLNICFSLLYSFKLHQKFNIYLILFLVDSMTLNMKSVLKDERISQSFFWHFFRFLLYRFKEKYCLKRANRVAYVSPVDSDFVSHYFSKSVNGKITVIPNGVDIPSTERISINISNSLALGTLTGFSEETVTNNLFPFLDSFFPSITNNFPKITFIIAGRGANTDITKILNSKYNVNFLGEVPTVSDFYDRVDIVVTTVKKECGIINRVLEAWAYGRLVIGFEKNFRAFIHAKNGVHYLSADNSDEFIQVLKMIINSPEYACRIAENGNDLVKKYYTWEQSGSTFLSFVTNSLKED